MVLHTLYLHYEKKLLQYVTKVEQPLAQLELHMQI